VRRLYSTFAQGPPGIGLLLIRLVAGTTAIVHGLDGLRGGPQLGSALFHAFCIGLGSLLIVGLWTPVAGALLALTALWDAFAHPDDRWYCLVIGTLGVGLALLGPGMWSIDARLFGWKRVEIRNRKQVEPRT
jgi:putative oxidoreductase